MEKGATLVPGASTVGLILAGGRGERLWPKSSPERPKQFLRLAGHLTLLQATFARLRHLLPPGRILVVTSSAYEAEVRAQLPDLPPGNLILEPVARGTAAAAGLACVLADGQGPDTVHLVVPADHLIRDEQQLARTLAQAAQVAQQGLLVTVGLPPTRPDTAYGYLKTAEPLGGWPFPVYRVACFREKPSLPVARRIYRDGVHLWNAGIFAWKVPVFLARLAQYLPQHARVLQQVATTPPPSRGDVLSRLYPSLPTVSIDHGVMEKVREGLVVIPGRFDWDDLGNWTALERLTAGDARGNRCSGSVLLRDCRGVLVDWEGDGAIVVGVKDLIIAGSGSRLLVCPRRHCHRVADLVRELERAHAQEPSACGEGEPCAF